MKTKDQITLNEVMNDGKTVHLYYNEMVGCFTAYGYCCSYALGNEGAGSVDEKGCP